jgi:CHAT domain-containing protein
MDEQQVQAYVELINKLFACPSGKEGAVLQQHSDLVDEGLVQVMGAVVAQLRQQGEGQQADWLENLAAQVMQAIGLEGVARPNARDLPGDLNGILQELNQPVRDRRQMARRVELCRRALALVPRQGNENGWAALQHELGRSLQQNPLGDRAENIEDAIRAYQQALQVRTREAMPVAWATSMNNLANAYADRIQGDQAENIEEAIRNHKQALQVRTREAMPVAWATSMHNLADACTERIRGDRAENIEDAIRAYTQALQITTREAMPVDWAISMMNLATAYLNRIRGDRAENIEDAIRAYEQALQITTREAMPVDWAISMMNLATAYLNRIRGDRAENIEDAIRAYEQALQITTREAMPVDWATSMMNLATAYLNRIRGDRAENIEDAIRAYQQALQVRTREAMPVAWATSMNNLANAYADRIQGDRAENIEDAIRAYEQALQITTREAMPVDWAESMNNLATAYAERIRGDRAENIEDAIRAYEQALQVRTREAMPVDWAESMNNLAAAYAERIRGGRAENIEDAIRAYHQTLQVRTREAMPVDWATSMMNLATAYAERIRGDRAENIEDAIRAYAQALQVRTREAMPVDWATSMNGLAGAYLNRIRGDQAENIEDAIRAYAQALQVRTREAMPVDWATSMNGLAGAYLNRIRGDQAENIEDAIRAYEQALQVRTREAMPVDWAESMNNLAAAYAERIWGDRAENIEDAIRAYAQALQVRTREAMPVDWATSMNGLAGAYADRIRGDRAENIKQAIRTYSQVLDIYTPAAHPNNCRHTTRLLADLYTDNDRWSEAQTTYRTALDAAEILYQAAISKGSQEAELKDTNDLYRRAAYAYAKVGDLETAIATIEQGRARSLSETLQRDRADLKAIRQINPELAERYQTAANAIRLLESTERRTNFDLNQGSVPERSRRDSAEDFRNQATQARQTLQDCLTEIRQIPGYESFLALPTFADIAATLQPDQPLVYLLHTPNGSLALILTSDSIADLWLDTLTDETLIDFLNKTWFSAYRQAPRNQQGWFDAIDYGTRQLWDWVMAPIVSHLQQRSLQHAILIPAGYLSFLPLHAAWTEDATKPLGRCYAFEEIALTYAPNALSLGTARTVASNTPSTSLFAINNPTEDLRGASYEVQNAINAFRQHDLWKVISNQNATRAAILEALPDYAIAHFSCHGSANFQTPLDSGLLMADDILSLRDLLGLKLQGLRLAILSACETGIPGTELPDEVISLPTGLLQAGAAGVVSSLWSVADLSTMLLLSRFYQLWRTDGLEPPEALRQAQIWLRDSIGPELAPYLQASHPELAARLQQATNQRPFAHPFHWAAFTYVGV